MAASVIPNSELLVLIGTLKTAAATGKIRLFQSAITFSPALTAAALIAIEANYSGYAEITLTTLPTPYVDPSGGVTFAIPTQEFAVATATPLVPNDIFGGWIEDTAGNLLFAFQFTPWPMTVVGQVLPLTLFVNLFGPSGITVLIGSVPQ